MAARHSRNWNSSRRIRHKKHYSTSSEPIMNSTREKTFAQFAQGKEIFSELVKPEQLMPHLLAFAHQYFFNPDWKGPIDEFGMDLKVVEAVKPLLEFFY